jgi:short-subunit dehydrogenase
MRARRQGGILNVASLGGAVPGPYQAVYYASKAYILSLTEAIGAEIAGEGVRISVLAPGPVETGFHAAMDAETSLYRVLLPSLMPERAARAAHLGFRLGRRVIVPGLLNMGLYGAVRVLPHPISVPLIRILLALRKK